MKAISKRIKYLSVITAFAFLLVLVNNKPLYAVSSVAEKVRSVFVTNWPETFKTREQNVDNNGNIKVAQQGIVDVNIANSSPIQVSTDNTESKIVTLIEDKSLASGELFYSDPIDVNDYKKLSLYVTRPEGNYLMIARWQYSLDGEKWYYTDPTPGIVMSATSHNKYIIQDIAGSKFRGVIENSSSQPAPSVSLYVYLIP